MLIFKLILKSFLVMLLCSAQELSAGNPNVEIGVSAQGSVPALELATHSPNMLPETILIASFVNGGTYIFIILLSFAITLLCWYKRKIYLALISIVVSALLIQSSFVFNLHKDYETSIRLDVIQTLSAVSARLDGNLRTNLSMITGFSAYISAVPDLGEKEFSNYAKELFKKDPLLINFAAAKDLVVNFVYPYAGNESVIGLDYRQNEEQRSMVLQVVETGDVLVAGPINLVQGGTAFIGRAPVFVGEGDSKELWGIISAPLNENALYRSSGLLELGNNVQIAIRKIDALGELQQAFYGDPAVFNVSDRASYFIEVGGGIWEVAGVANHSAYPLPASITMVRLISLIVTLFVCGFVVFRYSQQVQGSRMKASLNEYRQLLEKVGIVANIGGWKMDNAGTFTQWTELTSKTLQQPADFHPDDLSSLETLIEPSDFSSLQKAVKKAFDESIQIELEFQLNADKYDDIWIKVIATTSQESDESVHLTGTFQDVTSKVRSARIIEHQATYDALTDLPNRVLFNDRLSLAIEDAKRNQRKLGVLFIDLDRFKPVNDNHGHAVGDKLLIESAKRITQSIRHSDTVSRLSGDEFAVIICDIEECKHIDAVTDNILQALQQSYEIDNILIHSSASMGISLYPEDGDDAHLLVRKADQAMYEVKSAGRNGKQFYTREMQVNSEYKHHLLNDLIDAINKKVLLPYFQPIVNLKNNNIAKCEALARWQREDGQFVPPFEFIELAEESGLINQIDLYMLENSAQALIAHGANKHPVELSVNVSPRLFQTKDHALKNWIECIEKYAVDLPITVEITERLLTDDSTKALQVLTRLKKVGVKIAIDDFGTGYSSLSYLIKFPVDCIKIDRAFVDKIGVDETSNALIETILLMAKRLEIEVVAEGIETELQQRFLNKFECDYGQGYFLGRPMPLSDFIARLNAD
ncbi:MAG: diguanylate cyclase (GGDEF)-like protein [Glaciecola sp.]